ncbi:hypothetical protein FBQ96_04145, partial [Nitrospirales bacterium NOB]|nr:hypothetical protein [Nitrospirales bacterium NOB]
MFLEPEREQPTRETSGKPQPFPVPSRIPVFPLPNVVFFPKTYLPLHIFEPRYKEMIGLCLEEPCQFGVVLSSGNGVLRTGCAAAIHRVLKRYEDGKLDILAYGTDRFEIISIDSERSYFRADVRYFDDDDTRPARMK